MINKQLNISGMRCAACAANIERVLKRMNGVENPTVNFATQTLNFSYDQSQLRYLDIEAKIIKLGFGIVQEEEEINLMDKELNEVNFNKRRLIFTLGFAFPVFIISMGHMFGLVLPKFINPEFSPLNFAIIQLVLTSVVMFFAKDFFKNGIKSLKNLAPNMDSLISIGVLAAYLYGIFAVYKIANGQIEYVHQLYFESAATILAFVSLGKYLESIAKGKTSQAIKKLMGLAPKTAMIILDCVETQISIDDVRVGDLVVVKPGEKLPVDGEVVEGNTSIEESMLTGESMPMEKNIGDLVYGASINKNGRIIYKATKVGKDTMISQVIKLVKDAQGSKAPITRIADIISGYFVPIVILIAFLSSVFWYVNGENLEFILTIFICVLVIACPCALGLATPTAIMVGTGKGAENGILIKGGDALERTHQINTIVFDKTGTLTLGKPVVTDIISKNYSEEEILILAASLEKGSEHPLGEAIVNYANKKNLDLKSLNSFIAIPGMGIEGDINGEKIVLGNKKILLKNNLMIQDSFKKISDNLSSCGKTVMYIAINDNIEGIIAVADVIKENSKKVIDKLKDMGIEVVMLTGDNNKTADVIGKSLGIDNIISDVLPHEKAQKIKMLQRNDNIVAMVGDGINDAPALATANIGIAIGSGTDIAMESADIVLMRSNLMDVIGAIQLSRKTMINIKQNLFWGLIFNIIGIPIAMGVLYLFGGPLLNPMIGAFAMSFSSVMVISNALRLKKFKVRYD